LPDGSWLDVLRAAQALTKAPNLIVTSRLADTALWAEVLHLGGHDVLGQPFQAEEVMWVVRSAHGRYVGLPEAPSEGSTERVRSALPAHALR
jgi:DNA-binding response OmpR family regulator